MRAVDFGKCLVDVPAAAGCTLMREQAGHECDTRRRMLLGHCRTVAA
jgi:hypothetical protein